MNVIIVGGKQVVLGISILIRSIESRCFGSEAEVVDCCMRAEIGKTKR